MDYSIIPAPPSASDIENMTWFAQGMASVRAAYPTTFHTCEDEWKITMKRYYLQLGKTTKGVLSRVFIEAPLLYPDRFPTIGQLYNMVRSISHRMRLESPPPEPTDEEPTRLLPPAESGTPFDELCNRWEGEDRSGRGTPFRGNRSKEFWSLWNKTAGLGQSR